MATRRPLRVHCGFVANVLFAVVACIAACDGRDNVAGGLVDGGNVGTGSGGSGGSTISCNPTGGGCLCIADDAQPGQLTECSPTSVAQSEMEHGVCCVTQALCACLRYTCRSDPGSSFCQCGSVSTLASVTIGSPVAECPAPAAGKHCCFSQDNATCICSGLACADEETEVAGCSASAAGACNSGEDITACR
jgi:hypothetical protein